MICIICEMKCEHFQKLYNNNLHYNCAIKMDPEKLYFFIHPNFMKGRHYVKENLNINNKKISVPGIEPRSCMSRTEFM